MLGIVWNPRGFHLIKILEKGRKFNAGYDITKVLGILSQRHSIEAAGNQELAKIVDACGQGAPAYRQVINSIF
jgi:hypothetical protein